MKEILNFVDDAVLKCLDGYEFSLSEALGFLEYDLNVLGMVADRVRKKVCGDVVSFVADTTINYTNVCVCRCKFCAFYRDKCASDCFVLSADEVLEKVGYAVSKGATQILIQGGLNPDIPLDYYGDIIRKIKQKFPGIQRHFFSAPEISFIAKVNNESVESILKRFIDAGLQSLPGGGAEILDDDFRKIVSPNKISFSEWKNVMVKAHNLGLSSSATMVYGFGESKESRIKHLLNLRDIQKETHGFTAFIPWSFQPENTMWGGTQETHASGIDYLETIALSRIILNNMRNIQSSRLTEGSKLAQIALFYGANDFSGTIIEENVVKAAGINEHYKPEEEIINLIRQAKRTPAQRDTLYNIIKYY